MSSRSGSALAIALGAFAVLGTESLSYGLVYPARYWSKWPIGLGLLLGALLALVATGLSVRSLRRAPSGAERFLALLGVILSSFFLFVIVFGFGVPDLLLGPKD